jgi:hypothetical protein
MGCDIVLIHVANILCECSESRNSALQLEVKLGHYLPHEHVAVKSLLMK